MQSKVTTFLLIPESPIKSWVKHKERWDFLIQPNASFFIPIRHSLFPLFQLFSKEFQKELFVSS